MSDGGRLVIVGFVAAGLLLLAGGCSGAPAPKLAATRETVAAITQDTGLTNVRMRSERGPIETTGPGGLVVEAVSAERDQTRVDGQLDRLKQALWRTYPGRFDRLAIRVETPGEIKTVVDGATRQELEARFGPSPAVR